METGNYCAYNVTRNALLSDQVTEAESSLGSLQILGLVLHGPGAHQESAVWLRGFSRLPDLPRLATFDILYLDEAMRVLACGSVGPESGFPEFHERATSALILPEQRLVQTATAPGDQLQTCMQADLPAVIKAASQPMMESQASTANTGPGRFSPTVIPFEVIRPANYIYEPFVGSIMYIPESAEPQPLATEFFLPQTQSGALTDAAVEIAKSRDLPAESPAPAGTIAAPALIDAPSSESPVEGHADNASAGSKEPPRFYHPEPFRFFDPAAAGTENAGEKLESPGLEEPFPLHPGNVLPPELKAVIHRIDENYQHKQTPKQKPARKKKPGKSKSAEKQEIEPAGSRQPEIPEPPKAGLASEANVAETPAEAAPASPVPAAPDLAEPAPVPSASLTAPVELPIASPPVEVEPELAVPSNSPEPPLSTAPAEGEAIAASELETSDLLSAPAETSPDIELIEAFLKAAAADSTPKTAAAPVPPASGSTAPLATAEPPPQPRAREGIGEPPAPLTRKKSPRPDEPAKPKLSLAARFQRWLEADGRDGKRRGERVQLPGLVAFYWSGGAPYPHEIVNISKSGFYLRTRDLWSPNTLVRMTLQKPSAEGHAHRSISILARVVRIDDNGVGHEFVTTEDLMALHSRDVLPESGTDRVQLKSFLDLE